MTRPPSGSSSSSRRRTRPRQDPSSQRSSRGRPLRQGRLVTWRPASGRQRQWRSQRHQTAAAAAGPRQQGRQSKGTGARGESQAATGIRQRRVRRRLLRRSRPPRRAAVRGEWGRRRAAAVEEAAVRAAARRSNGNTTKVRRIRAPLGGTRIGQSCANLVLINPHRRGPQRTRWGPVPCLRSGGCCVVMCRPRARPPKPTMLLACSSSEGGNGCTLAAPHVAASTWPRALASASRQPLLATLAPELRRGGGGGGGEGVERGRSIWARATSPR